MTTSDIIFILVAVALLVALAVYTIRRYMEFTDDSPYYPPFDEWEELYRLMREHESDESKDRSHKDLTNRRK